MYLGMKLKKPYVEPNYSTDNVLESLDKELIRQLSESKSKLSSDNAPK